jgi:hypothetical protein
LEAGVVEGTLPPLTVDFAGLETAPLAFPAATETLVVVAVAVVDGLAMAVEVLCFAAAGVAFTVVAALALAAGAADGGALAATLPGGGAARTPDGFAGGTVGCPAGLGVVAGLGGMLKIRLLVVRKCVFCESRPSFFPAPKHAQARCALGHTRVEGLVQALGRTHGRLHRDGAHVLPVL